MKELISNINHKDELYKNYARPALISLIDQQQLLKDQRFKLDEIVLRVKFTVKNVKASAQAIFQGQITDEKVIKMLINHDITQMQELIKETEKVIAEAKKVYAKVTQAFGLMKTNIVTYTAEVEKLLDKTNRSIETLNNKFTTARIIVYPGKCHKLFQN